MKLCALIFALAANLLPGSLEAGEPIVLLAEPVHLGDQTQKDMGRAEPDADRFEATFDWPHRIGFGDVYLIVEVSHMTPRDYPGVVDGYWQTEVVVNGEPVGVLNKKLRGREETATVERVVFDFPVTSLKAGENTIVIRPGAKNGDLDDIELHRVVLSESRSTE